MVGHYRKNYSRSSNDSSFAEEETTSSMYSAGKEWTDEKHSLYLKSMEASFVDQLYNSLRANGSNAGPSRRRFGSGREPSEKQKMSVRQPEYRLNGRHCGGSHGTFRSPWIKHYKPLPKTITDEGSSELQNQEVSGQNFDNQGENGSSKKIKRVMSGSSSTDQVVPLRKKRLQTW